MTETVTIQSSVERIDDVRRWVAARAEVAHVDGEAIADMELALTEALANVIEHAYEGRGDREIRVGAEIADGALVVSVRDWGRPGNPESFESRDLDDPGEGGYGVFLMAQLMDRVTREPQPDGGTLLTLTKTVGTNADKGEPHG
jgi:anti-sigma regulatory factor (Ser/Thr protein kinase)